MNAIHEAKRRLPLPDLMTRLGLAEHAKQSARCPWPNNHKHGDKKPSFGIERKESGWVFNCFVCGGGDEITFLEKQEGLSNGDAVHRYCELAGVNGTAPANADIVDQAEKWRKCVAAITDDDATKLAPWRGYSPELVTWLRQQNLIGLHEPVRSSSDLVGTYAISPIVPQSRFVCNVWLISWRPPLDFQSSLALWLACGYMRENGI